MLNELTDMNSDSWWQRHKKVVWTLAVLLLSAGCIVFIICAYTFGLGWTGFNAFKGPDVQQYQPTKTLWDWLQLLVVPIVLAIAAYWFNYANNQAEQKKTAMRDETEHAIALDNQRAELLHDYLDRMSDLLLEQKFRDAQLHLAAQNIARARTLTVLPGLNGDRKGRLLQFLYESGLIAINSKECIPLQNADLSGANLRGFDLSRANLSDANLSGANLSRANLSEAQLQGVCLEHADLSGVILRSANLHKARLSEAILNGASLQDVNLTQANLSDARLERADLTRADFSDSIVNGARLERAILNEATISSVQLSKMWKS
jgi:uncharacterized protein YjbI with pentapeptide repeats